MKFYPNNFDENLSISNEIIQKKIIKNDPAIRFLDLSTLPFILNQKKNNWFNSLLKKTLPSVHKKHGMSELLINALKNNKYVKAIKFINNPKYEATQILAEIIFYNRSIQSLELKATIDTEFLKIILPSLRINNRIKRLSLENLNLDTCGCYALSQYLRANKSLKRVGLLNHQFDLKNLGSILEAISENQSIDELYIYSKESIEKVCTNPDSPGVGFPDLYLGVYPDLLKIKEFFNAENRKIRVKF